MGEFSWDSKDLDKSSIRYAARHGDLDKVKSMLAENPIPMADTFRGRHPDANDTGTFHGFKGTDTGDKIDYILTTTDVHVLDAQILHDNAEGRYPSDHFPVTARLQFPPRPTW